VHFDHLLSFEHWRAPNAGEGAMQAPELKTVEVLVQLANEFGPFLFAILFILFVTRTAHGYYKECSTRQNPAASDEERRTYRFYFVCSMWCGVLVMMLSIGWWVYARINGPHVFQIAIVNLQSDEQLLADYYFKRVPRPSPPGAPVVSDYFFLLVKPAPFEVGEKFAFDYYKIPAIPAGAPSGVAPQAHAIEVAYAGHSQDRYRIVVDAASGAPKLEVAANDDRGAGWFSTADRMIANGSRLAYAVLGLERGVRR
jgi:hypothetical protein